MQWQMARIAWLCLSLTACTAVQQNNEKPVFGDKTYQYKGWSDYCSRNPQDIDCLTL